MSSFPRPGASGRSFRPGAAGSAALLLALAGAPALAQNAEPTAPPPAAAPAPAGAAVPEKPDPVVARVNGQDIHLSDVQQAAQSMPEQMRNVPMQALFPMLIDQMIDREALVLQARKTGLDKDPAVQKEMARAQDQALQQALLQKEVGPTLTDQALRARYQADIAGKPGEPEVHAMHILVASEDEAKKIIAELKGGGDFNALAKKYSTDPAAQDGGDLGFFKKADMLPEFSAVAFALKPGEVAPAPVHTRYGWHVIKVVETRPGTVPSFEESRNELRQKLIQEGVQKAVAQARVGLNVEKFNVDGTPQKATDQAEPPPAAAK